MKLDAKRFVDLLVLRRRSERFAFEITASERIACQATICPRTPNRRFSGATTWGPFPPAVLGILKTLR